jgi:hypothetical protein
MDCDECKKSARENDFDYRGLILHYYQPCHASVILAGIQRGNYFLSVLLLDAS